MRRPTIGPEITRERSYQHFVHGFLGHSSYISAGIYSLISLVVVQR